MIKKTVTFEGLDGTPVTRDFYFNLTEAEAAEIELSTKGGLTTEIKRAVDSEDAKAIFGLFKLIVSSAYGVRDTDNVGFIKNQERTEAFMGSNAYSELFMSMLRDDSGNQFAEFVTGILPKKLSQALSEASSNDTPTQPKADAVFEKDGVDKPSKAEVEAQIEALMAKLND